MGTQSGDELLSFLAHEPCPTLSSEDWDEIVSHRQLSWLILEELKC